MGKENGDRQGVIPYQSPPRLRWEESWFQVFQPSRRRRFCGLAEGGICGIVQNTANPIRDREAVQAGGAGVPGVNVFMDADADLFLFGGGGRLRTPFLLRHTGVLQIQDFFDNLVETLHCVR